MDSPVKLTCGRPTFYECLTPASLISYCIFQQYWLFYLMFYMPSNLLNKHCIGSWISLFCFSKFLEWKLLIKLICMFWTSLYEKLEPSNSNRGRVSYRIIIFKSYPCLLNLNQKNQKLTISTPSN